MNIKPSEKKAGAGNGQHYIGYWKGKLVAVNPTAAQIKEMYNIEGDVEEPKYQGTDKNDKDWSLLKFVFLEETKKVHVEYSIFLSKEVAEFEKDGVTKTWYINQWGQSQLVSDKKDLFSSFTQYQKWNSDEKKFESVEVGGEPVELSYRKAYRGETALYALLRKMVTQNWFEATPEASLFIKIDALMRGKVTEITDWIDTENYQDVVGCIEIQAKDGDNGVYYNQNCIDGAWMPGWKIKEANLTTQNNGWDKYNDKANGKGKNRDIYEFYQAVKRNKHIHELKAIHEFDPSQHQAAGNQVIKHDDSGEVTSDYDI